MRTRLISALAFCLALAAAPCGVSAQATETTLYNFTGPDGAAPWGNLIQASDGNFYGATFEGGDNGTGALYRLTPGGAVTTFYSFPAGGDMTYPAASLVEGQDGNLYGVTCGNNAPTNGATIYGSMFEVTNFASAAPSVSTVFSFTGTSGTYQGTCPLGGLIQDVNGVFYGTTFGGGADDYGTVFSYNPSTSTFTTLHTFTGGADGGNPYSGLIQGSNGNFFGVTSAGGNAAPCPSTGTPAIGCGVIFRVASRNGAFLVLHKFSLTDGAFPTTQLVEGTDKYLYGTACGGGANSDGVLFKLLPDGTKSTYTKLVDLTLPNANNCQQGGPEIGPLWLGGDGNFYGAWFSGGANSDGEVFSYTPGATAVTPVYSFSSGSGSPYSSPIEGQDGNFYGPTIDGGNGGTGTLYKLTPTTAVAPDITLTSNNLNPSTNSTFQLHWNVTNANSKTMSLCYASSSSGTFTGKKGLSGKANIKETATGPHTYALTCGGVESATVTVNVTGTTGGTITLTSAGHNFGSVPEGSLEKYGIKLTNTTTQAFPFSLSLTGSSTFTEQDNCGTSVAAGKSCEIVFTYTAPSDSEWDNAVFTIAANGFQFSPSNTGTLEAHSVQPGVITLNSDKHDFGAVEFGDLPQFGLIISNGASSAVPLTFTPSGDTTDFTYSNDCPASLPAGGQCEIVFTYSPSSTSWQTFYMTISTGASGVPVEPGNQVELLGYGTNSGSSVSK